MGSISLLIHGENSGSASGVNELHESRFDVASWASPQGKMSGESSRSGERRSPSLCLSSFTSRPREWGNAAPSCCLSKDGGTRSMSHEEVREGDPAGGSGRSGAEGGQCGCERRQLDRSPPPAGGRRSEEEERSVLWRPGAVGGSVVVSREVTLCKGDSIQVGEKVWRQRKRRGENRTWGRSGS